MAGGKRRICPTCCGPKDFYAAMCATCKGSNGRGAVEKPCIGCGEAIRLSRSKAVKVFYCSKSCMAQDYKKRLAGSANPNFRGAGDRVCVSCGHSYRSYDSARKYCSRSCYKEVKQGMPKYAARRDANHSEIIAAFKKLGCAVMDTSSAGRGFPDLLVSYRSVVRLVEIKNPKSKYGKAGLSKTQVRFAEEWSGVTVHIVRTLDDVCALVAAWAGENVEPTVVERQSRKKAHRGFPVAVVSTVDEALSAIGKPRKAVR